MAYPTNPIYKLGKNIFTGQVDQVITQDSATMPFNLKVIPFDPDNTDYQKYLEWVAEGNTAEAAD
tara:strand:+ start:131 stop:325 length:195 start_codon:yes stop_codon:yes gene_type:complete